MPEYTLEEIFSYLEKADKPCIVAIDEFQQITKYQEPNIEALLRGRIQKLVNTHFIFAGSERRLMNEMFFSDKRPFFQSATLLQLEPINLEVYTDFAVNQFKAAEKHIVPEAVTWAYQTYNGVTMYVHKLLHDCYADTKAGETCDVAAMKYASEQLILAGEYTGTALGINHRGELLVETETGEVRNVLSGEVSVRGIYGYV